MIERVARAIWEQRRKTAAREHPQLPPLEEWGDGSIPRLNGVNEEARAAIEAMREPTDAIRDCFDKYVDEAPYWEELIDAALKEGLTS